MAAPAGIEAHPLTIDALPAALEEAVSLAEALYSQARNRVGQSVSANGKIQSSLIDQEQHQVHGLAWLATYVTTLKELSGYATRLENAGKFGETERLLVQIAAGEYLQQIAGGIPMNQTEFARLMDM